MSYLKYYIISVILFGLTQFMYAQYPQDTVWHPVTPDDLVEPNYRQSVHDDIYDVDIVRISDPIAFGYPDGAGQLLPGYSKTQSWNADMSKVQVGFTVVLNASDYSIYKDFSNLYSGYFNDGRWSNVNPNIRYFCWENAFLKIDVINDIVDTIKVFTDYNDIRIGPFEGNISNDDRYVVITDVGGTKATLYDISMDMEVSTKDFSAIGQVFDWASITPSGDYIAVTNYTTGNTELYDLNFNFLRNLTVGNNQHADFATDVNGDEVLVQVIPLSMTRLSDGVTTDLISDAWVCGNYHYNPNIAGHISGRNINNPGWALCSTQIHECSNNMGYNYRTEMFSVKLDGSGTIRPFGFAYTTCTSYDSYSKASISPDGTKVIFSSDWNLLGSNNSNVYAYVSTTSTVLPVSLISFNGTMNDKDVFLKWTTASEQNNKGFEILRSTDNFHWSQIGFIDGNGNSNSISNYQYVDKNPSPGIYYYKLKQIDFDGQFSYSDIIVLDIGREDRLTLFPNPTTGLFKIVGADVADVKIYNSLGQLIQDSSHSTNFDISKFNHGTYYALITTATKVYTKKVIKE